jgi:hypothetical protein
MKKKNTDIDEINGQGQAPELRTEKKKKSRIGRKVPFHSGEENENIQTERVSSTS